MKQNIYIVIDGSNFYYKLKGLGLKGLLNFDFGKFAKYLARNKKIFDKRYYVGKIRQDGTKKTEELFKNQQRLISRLQKNGFKYCFGYLMKTDGKYHEKGVDVNMAVDIVSAAYEKKCGRIVLVSSDTDLAPAIKLAQKKGIIVEYIGFSHDPSVAMVSFCKESRLLTQEEVASFVDNTSSKKKRKSRL